MSKKEIQDYYLFLGLPRTGKSTYFCTLADQLQKLSNMSDRINCTVTTTAAQVFVENSINRIRNQGWPNKTVSISKEDYELDLACESILVKRIICFIFRDYPGEFFKEAFKNDTENSEETKELKEKLRMAKGVFLLLSAEDIKNDFDSEVRSCVIGNLIRYVNAYNQNVKIAFLFNKAEIIQDYNHDEMEKYFKENYSIIYGLVKARQNRSRFFTIQPLGNSCEIDVEGNYVPPKELNPKGLIEPVEWATGLDLHGYKNFGDIIKHFVSDIPVLASSIYKSLVTTNKTSETDKTLADTNEVSSIKLIENKVKNTIDISSSPDLLKTNENNLISVDTKETANVKSIELK